MIDDRPRLSTTALAPGHLGWLLVEFHEALLERWKERVLDDPSVPNANRLSTPALEDHIPSCPKTQPSGIRSVSGFAPRLAPRRFSATLRAAVKPPTLTAPVQFLVFLLAGWISRRQQLAIGYLQAENQVLRQRLGSSRLRFTDGERRLLAEKAEPLGRGALAQLNDRS